MLNGRLLTIYNKIPSCERVFDIGTDHAYLITELVRNNKCNRAIGADIGVGPLKAAEKNARRYKVLDKIELRQGDGLEPVNIEEIDTVVIAGMGGELIARILYDGLEKAKKANLLVLQPMNAVDDLREFLYKNGFEIIDEELSCEGEKIYNIIVAKFDGIQREKSPLHLYIGEMLISNNDPLLKKYAAKRLIRLNKAVCGMEKSNNYNQTEIERIKALINDVEGIL